MRAVRMTSIPATLVSMELVSIDGTCGSRISLSSRKDSATLAATCSQRSCAHTKLSAMASAKASASHWDIVSHVSAGSLSSMSCSASRPTDRMRSRTSYSTSLMRSLNPSLSADLPLGGALVEVGCHGSGHPRRSARAWQPLPAARGFRARPEVPRSDGCSRPLPPPPRRRGATSPHAAGGRVGAARSAAGSRTRRPGAVSSRVSAVRYRFAETGRMVASIPADSRCCRLAACDVAPVRRQVDLAQDAQDDRADRSPPGAGS